MKQETDYDWSLNNLLIECADALSGRGYDGGVRDDHLRLIDEFQLNRLLTPSVATLLAKISTVFQDDMGCEPALLALDMAGAGGENAEDLCNELAQNYACPFVYHGTILGRLNSIAKSNLNPGAIPVWTDDEVSREYCNSAVFFATSWRAAMNWAEIAHARSKGPKSGPHRQPVVIRVRRDCLELQADTHAASPGCLMVSGTVSVSDSRVLIGPVGGLPKWRPIASVIR